MPWTVLTVGLLVIAAVGAALYGLHRFALWAEARGWIYYKTKRRPPGAGLGLIGQLYQPSIEHKVEEQQSQRIKADQAESGDDEDPDVEVGL